MPNIQPDSLDILNDEKSVKALETIIRAFDEVERLEGQFQLRFDVRTTPDSDLNSVVDVYLYPMNERGFPSCDEQGRHLQFLSNTVPPTVMGYYVFAEVEPHSDPSASPLINVLGKTISNAAQDPGATYKDQRQIPQ